MNDFSRDLKQAALFLTRLPMAPLPEERVAPLAASMRVFPLVGALIGLVGGLALVLAEYLEWPPLACGLAAVGAMILLTGGLHEDGLADCADAFGAFADKEKKLAILKDSRLGAFGGLALIFSVGLRASLLAAVPASQGCWMLIGACAISRASVPLAMQMGQPARPEGLGATAGIPDAAASLWALGLGIAAAFLIFQGSGLAVLAYTALGGSAVMLWAKRQIGGYTGDVLGAVIQVTETAVLIAGLP